jgi:shikimate kinase
MSLFSSFSSRLFLIGYRGSGKTTVAQLLARQLEWAWCDADAVLESRHGRTIRQIFEQEGEAGFRDKETALLLEQCGLERQVIATGGGIVLRPENRRRLREAGHVVWLTADHQTLWRRLQQDASTAERRPALTVGGLPEIEELLRAREPLYRECAHQVVDTAGRTPQEIADAILAGQG